MIPIAELLLIWGAFATAALAPGPNSVACAEAGLADGLRRGLLVAFGIAIAAFIWVLGAAWLLGELFDRFPVLIRVIAWGGAFWFLRMAWRSAQGLRAADGALDIAARSAGQHAVLRGVLVSLGNPKVALLWLGLSAWVAPLGSQWWVVVLLALGAAAIAFVIYGGLAWLFSRAAGRAWYGRRRRWFSLAFAVYFASFAVLLVVRYG